MASPFVISAKFTLDGGGVASTAGEIRGQFQSIESAVEGTAAAMQRFADQRQRLAAVSAAGINSALGVRDDFGAARRGEDIAAYGRAMDEMRAQYNPLFAAEQRHMANLAGIQRARQLGAISTREAALAVRSEAGAYAQAVASINSNTEALQRNAAIRAGRGGGDGMFATANIAAQFQDIAVTSAMGMAPLQIALQQGTQISAAFGNMGAAGAVRTLGAAFLSIVSPVSLVTIGLVGGAAAAIQYFSGLGSGAQDADERLDEHLERIEQIARGYDGAIEAAENYLERSRREPEGSVASNLEAARTEALDRVKLALGDIAEKNAEIAVDFMSWQDNRMIHADLIETMTDLGELGITAQSTQAEIDDLHTRLTDLANDPSAPQQARQYASDLLALMGQLAAARDEVNSVGAALRSLPQDIQIRLSVATEFGSAMADIQSLYIDPRSRFEVDRESLQNSFEQASATAQSYGELVGLGEQYQRVLESINVAETEAEAKATSRAAKQVSAFDRQLQTIQERTAAQQLETNVIGLGTFATERARIALELENAAREDAIGLSPQRVAQIQQEATAYALAAAAQEKALEAQQAATEQFEFYKGTFSSFVLDLKSGVQAGFDALASLNDDLGARVAKGGADGLPFQSAVKAFQASIAAGAPAFDAFEQQIDAIVATDGSLASVGAELKKIADDARDAADGWAIFGEAGANALDRIADRALGMAADGLFDMLFGAVMSGITGGVGGGWGGNPLSLGAGGPGFLGGGSWDTGGWTGNGNPSAVAGQVHHQEFVVRAGPAAQNRQLLEAMNSGASLSMGGGLNFAPVTNLYGEFGMGQAELRRMLDERDRRLLEQVPGAMSEARRRAISEAA